MRQKIGCDRFGGVLIRRAYRYRIYPTKAEEDRILRWQDALRFLWNLALEQRLMGLARARGSRKYYTSFDQINELTELRKELPWLRDVPRNVCAQLLIELDKAWQRTFMKLGGAPRFKKKGRDWATCCEPHAKQFRLEFEKNTEASKKKKCVRGSLVFPKLKGLRAHVHRALPGAQKTCTLVREGDQWFASISCEIEIEEPAPSTKPGVGIDRGVENMLADSTGRKTPRLAPYSSTMKKLARAQRRVAQKKKGSKNQAGARIRVARLHRKARRQREAVLHAESKFYAYHHGRMIVEALEIRNMTSSARGTVAAPGSHVKQKAGLNRSILDAAWGRFELMLKYKAVVTGARVEEVPAHFSSQTCAACTHVAKENRKSQSSFVCVACGHEDHADVNAAKVLYSRRTGGSAVCGGPAKRRPEKQKLRVVRRGNRTKTGGLSNQKAPDFSPV